ncbi:amino acid ABC transporter substrate-binding protein [Cryobacterium melibiosiphilum]|uniref:Amino acid ABC transporter substrate-binding protein n=1 Tax=Cryobacterium melibiosiphilum TaxID=995039 RepID=A0A3A5MGX0_9MICO|nr:amino acid ABC transporter substrate-binding protein [Cryobacterium melibiosiphilum]RJT88648.1 amino acid ABC transporter substrate-binding protein [Cryobacterium melibiosiphilum]RJT89410.1 amino acid ABC transporter substrate-binding protein [Cryobacterium melibiosiphilum]
MKLNRTTLRIASAVLLTATAVALTGCSTGGTTDDSLSSVMDSGVLTVGTEGTYRPFSFHEDGSGDLTGYDVEVIEAVAAELGVEASFEETQWDGIFGGLTSGRFDVIANQVSITPERIDSYAFSTPYTYSTGVIVVPEDNTSITSFDSLDGLTTAQSLTSNWYTLATESGATVEAVDGWAQSVALVEEGRVDATINDKLTFLDYQKQTGAAGLKVAVETTDRSESAFAVELGSDALASAISEALATLSADGTLAEISDTYFGADVSQ